MKVLGLGLLAIFLAVMVYAAGDLPLRGNMESPANVHVSPYYIENALLDTKTPNLVTAILADYRSYDTLGEAVVIFTAGLCCALILLTRVGRHDR